MSKYFFTLNLADCRMMMRHNLSMIPKIQANFKNNKMYKKLNYQCIDCLSIGIKDKTDTQQHLLSEDCVANKHLRNGRDLENPLDVVSFFRDLIKERTERETN